MFNTNCTFKLSAQSFEGKSNGIYIPVQWQVYTYFSFTKYSAIRLALFILSEVLANV